MKVFLSWAGAESKHIAQTLLTWLPQVIQAVEPWMSTRIEKGDTWDGAIAAGLDESPIGILCLTQESLESKYLHYEAGAISNVKEAKVCTILFGITAAEVKQPLARFQHTLFNKEDVLILLQTINAKVRFCNEKSLTDDQLKKALNNNWQELVEAVKAAPKIVIKKISRPDRELLEEILQLSRNIISGQSTKAATRSFSFKKSTTQNVLFSKDCADIVLNEAEHLRHYLKVPDWEMPSLYEELMNSLKVKLSGYNYTANNMIEILAYLYGNHQ